MGNLGLNGISIYVSGGSKASSRLITGKAFSEASNIMQMFYSFGICIAENGIHV